jgi:hypothetical protein
MTERKAKAKVEVELKDPGSALMQRAAQLLWDDLRVDDAWIDPTRSHAHLGIGLCQAQTHATNHTCTDVPPRDATESATECAGSLVLGSPSSPPLSSLWSLNRPSNTVPMMALAASTGTRPPWQQNFIKLSLPRSGRCDASPPARHTPGELVSYAGGALTAGVEL